MRLENFSPENVMKEIDALTNRDYPYPIIFVEPVSVYVHAFARELRNLRRVLQWKVVILALDEAGVGGLKVTTNNQLSFQLLIEEGCFWNQPIIIVASLGTAALFIDQLKLKKEFLPIVDRVQIISEL